MKLQQATPFFPTQTSRIELARQRYFEEGILPSGVVSDAVFQSWARCQRIHPNPASEVEFQPVTPSRAQLALHKNRHLTEAWRKELPALETILGATSCAAMLTDAAGVLIGATCAGRAHEHLMPVATRIGVDLSEEAVGTTAPGVSARTGKPVCVLGAEHFFEEVKVMSCAASPVRDIQGRVAGVLDISSELVSFNFDAASVVGVFAASIENRLLIAQSREHLVIAFQVTPALLDGPTVALAGIDGLGRVAWCNGVASRLLGIDADSTSTERSDAEATFGTSLAALASLPASGAGLLCLPNGLMVWGRSSMLAPDGLRHLTGLHCAKPACAEAGDNAHQDDLVPAHRGTVTEATTPPHDRDLAPLASDSVGEAQDARRASSRAAPSLRESDKELIERTLRECGGNISRAARKLGVSRGLIYRRMNARRLCDQQPD